MWPDFRRLPALFSRITPPLFFLLLGLYAIQPWLPGQRAHSVRTLVVYGFSITGEAMTRAIFPAFQAQWQAETGETIEFIGSFAGSGTVTNQLIMGVPADVALLALETDAERLVQAGILPGSTWRTLPHAGVVNRSPFIIAVRPGNPLAIHDFSDLTRPGLGVVHPDPLTSGAANWAILAEYGAAQRQYPDQPEAGKNLLLGLWRNVIAQASSARAARTQFENGFGDALITYEQDLLLDARRDRLAATLIYPTSTILSEHTLVVIDRHRSPADQALVDAFAAFLWSDAAQRLFADFGFRSVDDEITESYPDFLPIADPFTVTDLGGWQQARPAIIDGIWRDQVLREMQP